MREKCLRPLPVEWPALALCPHTVRRTDATFFSAIRDGNLGSVRFRTVWILIGHDATEPAHPFVTASDDQVGMADCRPVVPCRVALSVEVALLGGAEKHRDLVGPAAGGVRIIKAAAVISTPSDSDTDLKNVISHLIRYAVERNEFQALRVPREGRRAVLGLLQRDGGLHAHR